MDGNDKKKDSNLIVSTKHRQRATESINLLKQEELHERYEKGNSINRKAFPVFHCRFEKYEERKYDDFSFRLKQKDERQGTHVSVKRKEETF